MKAGSAAKMKRKRRGNERTRHGTRRDEGRREKEKRRLSEEEPDRSGSNS